MGRIGVLGFQLRDPGLCIFTPADRLDTGNEAAFLDHQFMVGGGGEGKRHLAIVVDGRSGADVANTRGFFKCKPEPLH
jgi:hypothetical protein